MNKIDISQIRTDYKLKSLDIDHVVPKPLVQLQLWLNEAISAAVMEPTAFLLSTVSKETLRPSSRVVLLKGITEEGCQFFTNYQSRKGMEINSNSFVAINFFWPELERQVRVEGKIQKVSSEESDNYYNSRPRGSKIGAIASPQSRVIESREILENKVAALEKDLEGKEPKRPEHWGGYLIVPDYFEFWQGRPSRLHDRIIYTKENSNWKIERLAP